MQRVAVVGIALMVVIHAWVRAFRRKGRARGRVTRIVSRPFLERSTIRTPEVSFQVDGREHAFVASGRVAGEHWRQGDEVLVAFDPREPESAVIAAPFHLYATPALLSVGLALLAYWLLRG